MAEQTGVSITLKAGAGYESPWIVIHGASVEEAGAMLQQLRQEGAFAAVRAAAGELQSATPTMSQAVEEIQRHFPGSQTHVPGQVWAGSNANQDLPEQYQPSCNHGPMKYIANGKYGPFWACPTPQGAPDKCKARNA